MGLHNHNTALRGAVIAAPLLFAACSLIDDDLSQCGQDYALSYELRLVTNISTELETRLSTQTDVQLAQALRQHLSQIFSDRAHDVDLSFYDVGGDSLRLHHDSHIMDASQLSYTLYLPMRRYEHLAVANVADNDIVELAGDEACHTARLALASPHSTTPPDTIDSHTTGLFTARQPMEVLEGVNQTFNVHLYMANCAGALVVDPRGQDVSSISVFTTGFATAFSLSDSTYTFSERSPIVRTTEIEGSAGGERCFCSVNFPSRETAPSTRTVIETTDPFVTQGGDETLWEIHAYVTLAGGTTTKTVLSLSEPLRAGQLRIIRAYVGSNGDVRTHDQNVGVSVTLNWAQGGTYEPEL